MSTKTEKEGTEASGWTPPAVAMQKGSSSEQEQEDDDDVDVEKYIKTIIEGVTNSSGNLVKETFRYYRPIYRAQRMWIMRVVVRVWTQGLFTIFVTLVPSVMDKISQAVFGDSG